MEWRKERINPMAFLKAHYSEADLSHITFNKKLKKGQYDVVRGGQNDGTMLFSVELIGNLLINIVKKASYCRAAGYPDNVINIKYTIGEIKHMVVFGRIDVPAGSIAGQRERFRMPVICEFIVGDK